MDGSLMKMAPVLTFAALLLTLGFIALWFTVPLWRFLARVSDGRRPATDFVPPAQALWSIRFGGLVALLMGSVLLWMYWRNR